MRVRPPLAEARIREDADGLAPSFFGAVYGSTMVDLVARKPLVNSGGVTAGAGPDGPTVVYDGTGQTTIAASPSLPSGLADFSISIRYRSVGSSMGLVGRNFTSGPGYFLYLRGSTIEWYVATSSSFVSVSSGSAITCNDGQIHTATGIAVGEAIQLWVDAVLVATATLSSRADASALPLTIANYFGNYFVGSVETVQSFPRALSPAEAATLSDDPLHWLADPDDDSEDLAVSGGVVGPVIGSRVVGSPIVRGVNRRVA